MEILAIWLVFAIIVGVVANGRGRSAIGWFLLALLISPLIAIIVLLVMGPGTPAPGTPGAPPAVPMIGVADEITKLAALRDAGTITVAEYEAQKTALLTPDPAAPRAGGKGMECSRCGKPQGWGWTSCQHCKASYAEFPPRPQVRSP